MQALSQLSYSPKLVAARDCTRLRPLIRVRVAPRAPRAGLYPSPSGMADYRYDPKQIEPRWQKVWADERTWEVENPDARPIDVEVPAISVSIDGPKVERIVENLIANALRHTPPGAHIRVWANAQDDGVVIGVDDAGQGVPEGSRESIFEPFEQNPSPASEHSPGVGIGLSLVRRFAELHGGRAWVEPRDGGGSSFRAYLPNR